MNILFVISEMYRGGAEKMVANLAEYFAVKKKSHVCIAVFNNDDSAYQLHEGIKYIKLNCSSADLKMKIPIVKKIRKVIKEEKIDVIIGFSIGISELLPFAVIGMRCRAIGSERSNPYLKRLTSVRKSLLNHILERLDGMIFTTTGCRDYYSKIIRDKSTVIPNGFVPKEDFDFDLALKCGSIIFLVGLAMPHYRLLIPSASLDMNLRQCFRVITPTATNSGTACFLTPRRAQAS